MMRAQNSRFSIRQHVPHFTVLLFHALQTPMLVYFVLAGNALTFLSAAVFTWCEAGHNSQVNGYLDGLWWAFTTVTTVGYGDIVPTSAGGRITAVLLMVTGISFFVGFAAVLVAAIDARATRRVVDADTAALRDEIRQLREEVRAALERP